MKLSNNIVRNKVSTLGRVSVASAGLALALLCPSVASAETTGASGATQIASLPATITASGTYYITQDFTVSISGSSPTSGVAAINVNAPNVTIDLNGHTITNTYGSANLSAGVRSTGQTNVTLQNGTIKGFTSGFYDDPSGASTSSGLLVQDVTFFQETANGALISGANGRIIKCRAISTGGATVDTGNTSASGFSINGNNGTIEDCVVSSKTTGSMPVYGIAITANYVSVVNNRVSSVDYGIYVSATSDKYRDNIVTNAATSPYVGGGTNIGNNN